MKTLALQKQREIPRTPENELKRMFPWLADRHCKALKRAGAILRVHRWVLILGLVGIPRVVFPCHISGANIAFQCQGGDQYVVRLKAYIECFCGSTLAAQETIVLAGACGTTINLTVNQASSQEVSIACSSVITTCNGGTGVGMLELTWTGTATLPSVCGPWTATWTNGNRNGAIVNLVNPGAQNICVTTTMNPTLGGCNSSAVSAISAIPYVCANQAVSFNLGLADPDGDQLVYSFAAALGAPGAQLAYQPPFTANSPIPGIQLDPATGQINFTSAGIGIYIVVLQVSEFNEFGQLVATSLHDLQFVVDGCPNQPPVLPSSSSIDPGMAIDQGGFIYAVCAGDPFDITMPFSDPDQNDTLVITSNVGAILPGAQVSQTGSNPALVSVHWEPTPGLTGVYAFTIVSTDNGCPMVNTSTLTITVNVDAPIVVSCTPDTEICALDTAWLFASANGGSGTWTINWSHGVVGSGPHAASPTTTTSYSATVTDDLGCTNSAYVSVTVHPLPHALGSVDDREVCIGTPTTFSHTSTASGETCVWDLGDGTIVPDCGPFAHTFSAYDCHTVNLTVTSSHGCVKDSTYTDMVCIRPYPEAGFNFGPQPTDMDDTRIDFENTTFDTTAWVNYVWVFGSNGELGNSSSEHPFHYFPNTDRGSYAVTLITENIYGCIDSVQHTVVIDGVSRPLIPNAFTPNGDGLNDNWHLAGLGFRRGPFQLRVFDRWGQECFSTTDPDEGWNGRFGNHGEEVPTGMYAYRALVNSDFSTEGEVLVGHVTLIR